MQQRVVGRERQCALQGLHRHRRAARVQLQDRQVTQRFRMRGCLRTGLQQERLRTLWLAIAQRACAGMHQIDHGRRQAGHARIAAHSGLPDFFSRRARAPGRQAA